MTQENPFTVTKLGDEYFTEFPDEPEVSLDQLILEYSPYTVYFEIPAN